MRLPDENTARTEKWSLRLTATLSAQADARRGGQQRSDYIRDLIRRDVRQPLMTTTLEDKE